MLGKLLLALHTYGTNDVYAYERFLVWSRALGVGLYRAAWDFNHPPAVIHVLRAMGWLADTTGVSFPFWLRLPGILADAGSLWLVWRILGPQVRQPAMGWAVAMLAAAPAAILVSGFHGNTDGVMVFFVVLSVYLTGTGRRGWDAGAAMGLAMCFKIVPIVVAPVVLLHQADAPRRIAFVAAALLVVVLGWSPFVFEDPAAVFSQVLGYRGYFGHWGLSFFTSQLAGLGSAFALVNEAFRNVGAYLVLVVLGVLSAWMNWPESRGSLYAQVGLLFFVFLALSNGFGVQYLAWLVPWTAGAGALPAAAFHLTSGAFLFLVYRYWLGGGPWYLADSNRIGDWLGHLDYFQVLCWASVVALAWAAWRRMRSDVPASVVSFGLPARAAPIVAVGIAAALVGYPVVRQLRREPAGQERAAVERQLLTIRTNDYVWLSYQAYSMGRFDAALDAAHHAVILDPSSADGYNNLAAGYAALGMWDEAIESALAALQIRPDYTLARNNLAWALQQKRLERADGTSP